MRVCGRAWIINLLLPLVSRYYLSRLVIWWRFPSGHSRYCRKKSSRQNSVERNKNIMFVSWFTTLTPPSVHNHAQKIANVPTRLLEILDFSWWKWSRKEFIHTMIVNSLWLADLFPRRPLIGRTDHVCVYKLFRPIHAEVKNFWAICNWLPSWRVMWTCRRWGRGSSVEMVSCHPTQP